MNTNKHKNNIQRSTLQIFDCGVESYEQILTKQYELRDKRRTGEISDTVLIVEHQPVITLGAHQSANKLQVGTEQLKAKGIEVAEIRRGGGATAHNPGQLVFYPILNLKELRLGINEYIRTLEQIGIELLGELNITAGRRKGYPGLWIGEKKIASTGVRVSRGITYHGMAINISNDLSIFDYIVPCGIEDVKMTSVLNETGRQRPMAKVKEKLKMIIRRSFGTAEKRGQRIENGGHKQRRTTNEKRRLPDWLKRPLGSGRTYAYINSVLDELGLQTICNNANCPNKGRCWNKGTATVLILGNICTRNCKFCSVSVGKPLPPDSTEPARIAEMAEKMDLKYLVITSVNRDDLPDGGAAHFTDCVNTVRRRLGYMKFEILVPDFRNCQKQAIENLSSALPFVFAHNVETVPSLYKKARAGGDYELSLNLLELAREELPHIPTKSSIMLGLGESDCEVKQVLKDLRSVGCSRITIGQYLKPSKDSLDVVEYITPEKFKSWKQKAIKLGFSWVISEPFARSSYFAEKETTNEHELTQINQ